MTPGAHARMNLDFQDPFGTAKPKTIEKIIDDFYCRTLAISRNGRYLASGCSDKSIIIYDLSVYRRVAKISFDEIKSAIQSICFNRKSDKIAISFDDGEIVIKNILSGLEVFKSKDDSKIVLAKYDMNNFSGNLLIVLRQSGKIQALLDNELSEFWDVETKGKVVLATMSKYFLFIIDSSGLLSIISLETRKLVASFSDSEMGITESSGITSISCHENLNILNIVCKNRCIRVMSFNLEERKLITRFKLIDAVNKWSWRLSGFSDHETLDSLFIYGTVMSKGKHLIYLWENVSGTLVQTLEGPKEETSIAIWHPKKPQLITVGALSGNIYVWGPDFPQKWAALVPNIEAIETNIEFIEREDEFDLSFEEEIKLNKEHDESVEIEFKDFINYSTTADQDSDDLSLCYPIN